MKPERNTPRESKATVERYVVTTYFGSGDSDRTGTTFHTQVWDPAFPLGIGYPFRAAL